MAMEPEVRMARFLEAYWGYHRNELTCEQAGELLGMSERQFRRLRDRYEAEGAEGIADRRLGRKAHNQAPVDDVEWMVEQFVTRYRDFSVQHFHAQQHVPFPLRHFPLEKCVARGPVEPLAHIGVHPQSQTGRSYVGIVLPVGRLQSEQMRGLAKIADRYGSGTIRLTVWQNLLISDIAEADLDAVKREIELLGLHWSATNFRAGLVACTGNAGCKFAASNTKSHALRIADYLDSRLSLDVPLNIHLTGCHHSCAQHYIGDIGLLATKVPQGDEQIEGYHLFLGGGYGDNRAIGREIYRNVVADEVPQRIEQMLLAYLAHRRDDEETFREFTRRHSQDELVALFETPIALAG